MNKILLITDKVSLIPKNGWDKDFNNINYLLKKNKNTATSVYDLSKLKLNIFKIILNISNFDIVFLCPFYRNKLIFLIISLLCYSLNKKFILYLGDSPFIQTKKIKNIMRSKKENYFPKSLSLAKYYFYENFMKITNTNIVLVEDSFLKHYQNLNFNKKFIHILYPCFVKDPEINSFKELGKYCLFLRPNAKNTNFLIKSITKKTSLNIILLNPNPKIGLKHFSDDRIIILKHVDSINSLISNSKFVIINDEEGIGFCNRSVNTLVNDCSLISNSNGLRGLDSKYKELSYEFNNIEEFNYIINKNLKKPSEINRLLFDQMISYFSEKRYVSELFKIFQP